MNILSILSLASKASQLAVLLQSVDPAAYESGLQSILADGEKISADIEALVTQIKSDAAALKAKAEAATTEPQS